MRVAHGLSKETKGKKPWMLLQTPRTKKRSEVLREVRDVIRRYGCVRPTREVIERINAKVRGWVAYFCRGTSAKVFSPRASMIAMSIAGSGSSPPKK